MRTLILLIAWCWSCLFDAFNTSLPEGNHALSFILGISGWYKRFFFNSSSVTGKRVQMISVSGMINVRLWWHFSVLPQIKGLADMVLWTPSSCIMIQAISKFLICFWSDHVVLMTRSMLLGIRWRLRWKSLLIVFCCLHMLRLAVLLGEDRVDDQRIGVVEIFYTFLLDNWYLSAPLWIKANSCVVLSLRDI